MNAKNKLQEYCQQNKLANPVYNLKKIGGNDHKPIWEAKIYLFNTIFAAIGPNKTAAELLAANQVLKYLDNKSRDFVICEQKVQNVFDINFDKYNNVIFVNAENCDIDTNIVNNHKNDLFLIFCAKNSPKNIIFELQKIHDNCFVFIAKYPEKNLTFHAGIIYSLNRFTGYHILKSNCNQITDFTDHESFINLFN